MRDESNRIEEKLDRLGDNVNDLARQVERYNVLLEVHIRRTDENSADIVKMVEEHTTLDKKLESILAVSRVIKTGVPLLLSLIGLLAALKALL
jgi:hypothetical protein